MKPHLHILLVLGWLVSIGQALAQTNAPASLLGTAPAYNQVVLTWKDNSTGETKFEIERNNFASFTKIGEAPANATTYTDNTAGGGTYRVRAILATGAPTGYSNEFTISTPPEPPTVPTSLAATAPSASTIHLTWTNLGAGTATDFLLERGTSSGGTFTQIAVVPYSRTPTYDDSQVLPGTQYCYRVRARGPGGTSGYSNVSCATTAALPVVVPIAPNSPGVLATSDTQLQIFWNDSNVGAVTFELERAAKSGGPYTVIATSLTTKIYDDKSLTAATQYCYRVRAKNSAGYSGYSNEACGTTAAPPVVIPTAPARLVVAVASSSQLNLSWADVSDNETGFQVERSTDGINFSKIADLPANTTSYASTGLNASTRYYYRVRAVNTAGPSGYSNVADATTSAPPVVVPNAPVRLAVAVVSPTQLNLTWADGSDNETGFQVERASSATAPFTKIADLGVNTQTYSDAGLAGGTPFCYRVRAVNTAGASGYTEIVCATTTTPPVPAPAAPSALVATAASASQINLNWADNANSETGFDLERSTDNVNFTKIADLPANTTSYANTGLTQATRYYYRVRAVNAGGGSAYSNTADATTPDVVPTVPVRLTAQAVSFSQINLAWADQSGNETGFELDRSTDGVTFVKIADLPANTTTYANTGLNGSTRYYYRVRAINGIGASGYSNIADATTTAPPVPPPAAPSALVATVASASQINLSWTDNAGNETGFEVERSTDGTTFSKIADLPANTNTYQNTDLAPTTRYYYRVRAVNSGGGSGYTNTADATTPDVAPAAPARLTLQVVSFSQINLTWADQSGNETGFEIERSTDGNTFTKIGAVGANGTTYAGTGLSGSTHYYYRVRAVNAIGASGYSNTADATTSPAPIPDAPTNLTAVPVDFDLIKLTWSPVSANTTSVVIERSTSSTGGFVEIGQQVPPKTDFGDVGILPVATYYYRIKAVNGAGVSAYSNIATVDATSLIDAVEPVREPPVVFADGHTLHIRLNGRPTVTLQLVSLMGQVLATVPVTANGLSDWTYSLQHLPGGAYIVSLTNDGFQLRKKILVP